MDHYVLDNGIKLGGVFSEFHQKIEFLKESNNILQEQLLMLNEDHLVLYLDKEKTKSQWNIAIKELNLKSSVNSNLKDLLDEFKANKITSDDKIKFLEENIENLKIKLEKLTNQVDFKNKVIEKNQIEIENVKENNKLQMSENECLLNLFYQKEEECSKLNLIINGKDEEISSLKRSLSTKDTQLVTISKDRDRIKSSLENARNSLLPKQKVVFNKTLNSSSFSNKENKKVSTDSITKNQIKLNEDIENFDSFFISNSGQFDIKERQYITTIKSLKSKLKNK